jgi:putative phage-type endonuclease
MKIVNLKQGTKSWLDWRRTKITASDSGIILEMSPFKKPDQLLNEKLKGFETVANCYMRRGLELEPVALRQFEKETGLTLFPCVGVHDEIEWMGASFDGMTIEGDAIVEIKAPGKKDHFAALNGIIPDKYKAQLNHQMVVADVQEMFYFSFDGEKGVIIEVKRDEEFIEVMIEKEREFWERLQQQPTPSLHSIVA